jgi:hypothetical protein
VEATPAADGSIVDISTPSEKQLSAWSHAALADVKMLAARADELEREAAKMVSRAVEAREAAKVLYACVQDQTILPKHNFCRVCVSKLAITGWRLLMTNCDECQGQPIHCEVGAPFRHRASAL